MLMTTKILFTTFQHSLTDIEPLSVYIVIDHVLGGVLGIDGNDANSGVLSGRVRHRKKSVGIVVSLKSAITFAFLSKDMT
jgi:hypothetical protein